MDYKKLPRTLLEFRVWSIDHGVYLNRYQTKQGQWVWGLNNYDYATQYTWEWIIDHPDSFVVCQYVGESDTKSKNIYTFDIIGCKDESGNGFYKEYRGIMMLFNGKFSIVFDDNPFLRYDYWQTASNLIVLGNVFENPNLLIDL